LIIQKVIDKLIDNYFFDTSKESNKYISGVILYEETLFQKTDTGVDFVKILKDSGIVPGIKVDLGLVDILGTNGEQRTQGLDKLEERFANYYKQGARFAKWRQVYKVSDTLPSNISIEMNAIDMARYALICQSYSIVPIVEPECLVMEGEHSLERSFEVTELVLSSIFYQLIKHKVNLELMILKPNMVLPGTKNKKKFLQKKLLKQQLKF